eukprot:TRINITY_DN78904_c0_g1_i1.p1 TRINITY_DN78904_c0_g1~~TRINITY_DN78904_c0_g1_i1.p1  ORF type:complete len:348 (+),score=72.42 TRINITY_DN78904_c0_g1_i1:158-1201(+)
MLWCCGGTNDRPIEEDVVSGEAVSDKAVSDVLVKEEPAKVEPSLPAEAAGINISNVEEESKNKNAESPEPEKVPEAAPEPKTDPEPAPTPAPAAPAAEPEPEAEGYQAKKSRLAMEKAGGKAFQQKGKRRPSSENVTLDDYIAKYDADFKRLLAMEPMEGWTLHKEAMGAKIYLKPPEGDVPFCQFKSIVEFDCGPNFGIEHILAGLTAVEDRLKWDEMVIQSESVEMHSPFYRITYAQIRSPAFIIANRDICLLGRMRWLDEGGLVMCVQSTPETELPEVPGFVRSKMLCGGYIVRPTAKPNTYTLIWTGCVDPAGWLPAWVANHVAWKQGLSLPKFLAYLKEQLK